MGQEQAEVNDQQKHHHDNSSQYQLLHNHDDENKEEIDKKNKNLVGASNTTNSIATTGGIIDKDTSIVIVGCGIAGMSAAISLLKEANLNNDQCIEISMYERDNDFLSTNNNQRKGFGLTLSYNPKGPLGNNGMDILEKVAQKDCPSRSHYIFKTDGSILGYYGNAFFNYTRNKNNSSSSNNNNNNSDSNENSISTTLNNENHNNSDERGCGQRGNLRVPRHVLLQVLFQTLQKHNNERQKVNIYWNHTLSNVVYNTTTAKSNNNDVVDASQESSKKIVLEFKNNASSVLNKKQKIQTTHFVENNPSLDVTTTTTNGNPNNAAVIVDDDTNRKDINNNTDATCDGKHTKVEADILIAADGIHSTVVSKLTPTEIKCQPKKLNIMIILGITENFHHSLLNERGFYSIDGKHRLFTMPYNGDRISSLDTTSIATTSSRQTMWQLSFSYDDDHHQDYLLSSKSSKSLKKIVWDIVSSWHDPIPNMIQSTQLDTIWGTPLLDKDPQELYKAYKKNNLLDRVLVIGDALHGMSPFKGQGANQALMDGPLISKWLIQRNRNKKTTNKNSNKYNNNNKNTSMDGSRNGSTRNHKKQKRHHMRCHKVSSAMHGIWREAVQRVQSKVEQSKEAANYWHSEQCLVDFTIQENKSSNKGVATFSGIQNDQRSLFLQKLLSKNLGANNDNLDEKVWSVIDELGIGVIEKQKQKKENHKNNTNNSKSESDDAANDTHGNKSKVNSTLQEEYEQKNKKTQYDKLLRKQVLEYSQDGRTELLRNLSINHNKKVVGLNNNISSSYASSIIRSARNDDNRTCLHLAVQNNHYQTCKWLLTESFVDPNAIDKYGKSALHYADNEQHQSDSSVVDKIDDHEKCINKERLLIQSLIQQIINTNQKN